MEANIKKIIDTSKCVLIKVGSNVLNENSKLSTKKIKEISTLIKELKRKKKKVILVSSGAILTGRGIVAFKDEKKGIKYKQALSSIGQIKLISEYRDALNKNGIISSQILLSLNDFLNKTSMNNIKETLNTLIKNNIVPIINENDTTATFEITFGDNDILASKIAGLIKADLIMFLSDIDGIYKDKKNMEIIRHIKQKDLGSLGKKITIEKKGSVGSGGIESKIKAIKIIAKNKKAKVILLNGKRPLSLKGINNLKDFTLLCD